MPSQRWPLPGPGYDPRATCPKCGKAVMLFAAKAHMLGHEHEDATYEDWTGEDGRPSVGAGT